MKIPLQIRKCVLQSYTFPQCEMQNGASSIISCYMKAGQRVCQINRYLLPTPPFMFVMIVVTTMFVFNEVTDEVFLDGR